MAMLSRPGTWSFGTNQQGTDKEMQQREECAVQIRLLSLICLKVNMEIQLAVLKKRLSSEKSGAPRRARRGKHGKHANQQSWWNFLPLGDARASRPPVPQRRAARCLTSAQGQDEALRSGG